MIKLGNPPKFIHFLHQSALFINTWFREVTTRLTLYRKNSAFSVAQLPEDQWVVTKDTDNGVVGLAVNDNGTLKSLYVPPVFYAYRTTASSYGSDEIFDPVVFDAELFDTEGWYDTSTGKFQPELEGYYLISGQINFSISAPGSVYTMAIGVLKNGVKWSENWTTIPNVGNIYFATITTILYMNGSTDYVQIGAWQNTGVVRSLGNLTSSSTFFTGTLVRGAA